MKKKNWIKRIMKTAGILLLALLCVVVGYLAYVFIDYHRIEDNLELAVNDLDKVPDESVVLGKEYTAITYNIGFGAYTPDFSFFMDGGKSSWAKSKESVIATVSGACNLMKEYEPDFMLVEEVDTDATRSYHVNQKEILDSFFPDYCSTEAVNFDSPFLFWPLTEPHGKSHAEMVCLSAYPIADSIRRSLPISTSVTKLVDLDRCYSISRVPVENGKLLSIYTLHLSAYGMDASVREGQVAMLREDMEKDLAAGNYIICGGDYNHDLKAPEGEQGIVNWACPLPRTRLAEGVHFVIDEFSADEIEKMHDTARNTDIPYEEGVTYTVTLDGFIISDNITVTSYEVPNTGYLYSDHEPVIMHFVLN